MSSQLNEPDQDKPILKFIVPKIAKEQLSVPVSISQTHKFPLRMRPPISKTLANILQKIGLQNTREKQVITASQSVQLKETTKNKSTFTTLNNFEPIIVSFANKQDEERAKDSLCDKYNFIPNFALSLPKRVAMNSTSASSRTSVPNLNQWPKDSGIEKAKSKHLFGQDVMIGVLDSGIDAGHSQFNNKPIIPHRYFSPIHRFYDRDVYGFDTDKHGTHISGVVAGETIGIVPKANLYVASVLESETATTTMDRIYQALDWIVDQFIQNAPTSPAIINLSLGFENDISTNEYKQRLLMINQTVNLLRSMNILVIAAIGNKPDPYNQPTYYTYPGACETVLGVGAIDFRNQCAIFSGNGNPTPTISKPNVVGYGVNIHSSVERDWQGTSWYESLDGTSMATSYVTGIAALYWCETPSSTAVDIWDKIISTTLKLSGKGVGEGLARFYKKP